MEDENSIKSNSATQQELVPLVPVDDSKGQGNTSYTIDVSAYKDKTETSPTLSKDEANAATLSMAFMLMLFFQLGNRLFYKLATYPMYNYPLYMNLMSTFVYIPISFAYIWPMSIYAPHIITKEMCNIPLYKFGVMGTLDSLAGAMSTFAVTYITDASIIVLVQQSAIPISMVISSIFLGAQYTFSQILGAGIVILGILVVLFPEFTGGTTSDDANSSSSSTSSFSSGSNSDNTMLWLGVLALSCIPATLSSVYKEFALGEEEIDVVYLNGWVAVFQSVFAIPLCIPSAILISLPLDQIVSNFYGGLLCSFGINTVTEATATLVVDDCSSAPFFWWTYIAFNVVFNVLIIVILKYGSANILWLSSTVIVPLSNVAFSLPFMPNSQPMQPIDLLGLVVIMSGLVVYRFTMNIVAWWQISFGIMTKEEIEAEQIARSIASSSERNQFKFLGLNQIEAVNTLMDYRVLSSQKKQLRRSSQQIRGTFLARIGIPPSPLISIETRSPGASYTRSPGMNYAAVRNTPRAQQLLVQGRRGDDSPKLSKSEKGVAVKKRANEV